MRFSSYAARVFARLTASLLLIGPAFSAHFIAALPEATTQARAGERGIDQPTGRSEWRREALETMRVAAAGRLISEPRELDAYRAAGFNTLSVFDVNGCDETGAGWNFKSAEQIRAETTFARQNGLPLILGMAVEPFDMAAGRIPEATDDQIRERLELWKKYGEDVVIGVFPWYDDVFWHTVDVGRQLHVYELVKDVAPDWYVFGMIGEFGFKATDHEVARYYDPAAFDHLIVLMYPYDLGSATGSPLDHVASTDPDGDMTRYVDRYIAGMEDGFFRHLQSGQLIVLVGEAFSHPGQADGRIPRREDIVIMMRRGNERIREISGQERNYSAAYYYWGADGASVVGLWQRGDWREAAREVHESLERARPESAMP